MIDLTIICWIMNVFGTLGVYETSKPQEKADFRKMNMLFTMTNTWSVIYFLIIAQYPYVFLQSVYLFFAILGMYRNKQKMKQALSYQIANRVISN